MTHHCHAVGCQTPVPPRLLMCGRHWAQVPKDLQRAVWDAYRPGQEDDKRPSHAWHLAATDAIAAVFRLEVEAARVRQLRAEPPQLALVFTAGAGAGKTRAAPLPDPGDDELDSADDGP